MPLTVAGKLDFVASADLGGLGLTDGPPTSFDRVISSSAPVLLPWLIILGLLAAKANQTAQAWLIWLPLGCAVAVNLFSPTLPYGMSILLSPFVALCVAVAAVWLFGNRWQHIHRMLAFLCLLATLIGFGLLGVFCKLGENSSSEATASIVFAVLGGAVSSVAMSLTGLMCRKRFRLAGVYLWMLLFLAAILFVLMAPFFLVAMFSNGSISPSLFFTPYLGIVTLVYAAFLPFLILSSVSPFYRERLKALLQAQAQPPPLASEPALDLTLGQNATQTN